MTDDISICTYQYLSKYDSGPDTTSLHDTMKEIYTNFLRCSSTFLYTYFVNGKVKIGGISRGDGKPTRLLQQRWRTDHHFKNDSQQYQSVSEGMFYRWIYYPSGGGLNPHLPPFLSSPRIPPTTPIQEKACVPSSFADSQTDADRDLHVFLQLAFPKGST